MQGSTFISASKARWLVAQGPSAGLAGDVDLVTFLTRVLKHA